MERMVTFSSWWTVFSLALLCTCQEVSAGDGEVTSGLFQKYQNMGSNDTTVYFNTSQINSLNVSIQALDTRDDMGDLAWSQKDEIVVDTSSLDEYSFNILEDIGARPCIPLNISINDQDNFTVWTSGFEATSIVEVEMTVTAPETSPKMSTAPFYTLDNVTAYEVGGSCNRDVFLHEQSLGIQGSSLWVDGRWLGQDNGDTTPSVTLTPGQPIDSVRVHKMNDTGLLGLRFFSGTSDLGLIGSESGADRNETVNSPGKDSYLLYITVETSSQATHKMHFAWAMAAAPFNVYVSTVLESEDTFHDEMFQNTDDRDASQMEVRFWLPVDTNDAGVFLVLDRASSAAPVDLSTQGPLSSSMDYTRRLYGLQPQTDYNFTLSYEDGGLAIAETGSLETDATQFTTSDGVRFECSQDGAMKYQIEYEAVPQIRFYHVSSEMMTFGNYSGVPEEELETLSVPDSVQQLFSSSSDYFQYSRSADAPHTFRGYPHSVTLYNPDSIRPVSPVRGFVVHYLNDDGTFTNVTLAGDESQFGSMSEVTVNLTGRVTGFTYSIFVASNVALQMGGIQFQNGETDVGSCVGNGCGLEGVNSSQITPLSGTSVEDYFVSSFTILSSSQSEPGVYGIQLHFTAIGWHTLQSLEGSSCELDEHINYQQVRASAWSFNYDLTADTEECGTVSDTFSVASSKAALHGSQKVEDDMDHAVVYYQTVTLQGSASGGGGGSVAGEGGVSIVRSAGWESTAFCYYNASANVMSSFGTLGETGMDVAGARQFQFRLQFAQDSSFDSLTSSAVVSLGEEVFFQVNIDTENEGEGYVVYSHTCWATPSDDSTDSERFLLETEGCAEDDTFERLVSSEDSEENFKFDAFGWSGSTLSAVYIHCSVLACPADQATNCQPPSDAACSDDVVKTKRHRRNTDQQSEEGDFHASIVSSNEPLIVSRRAAASSQSDFERPTYLTTPAFVAVAFALAAFVVFLALAALNSVPVLRRRMEARRNTNYNHLNEHL